MKQISKKVICFFTDNQTFEELHQQSSNRDISLSQLLRSLVRKFLASEGSRNREHDLKPSINDPISSTFQKVKTGTTLNRKEK